MSNKIVALEPGTTRGRKEKVTVEEIKLALVHTRGKKALAARHLGISRATLYNYIERYPEIMDTVNECVEQSLDAIELVIEKKARAGDLKAAKFYLSWITANRGLGGKPVVDSEAEAARSRARQLEENARHWDKIINSQPKEKRLEMQNAIALIAKARREDFGEDDD